MAALTTVEVPIDRDFDHLCDALDRDAIDVLREVLHAPTAEERHVTVAAARRVGGVGLRSDVEVEVLSVTTEFEPALGPIGDLEFAIEGRSRLQRAIEARLRAFVAALRARIPAGG